MHNIPSIILLAILIISWRHENVGGIIFMTLGIICFIGILVITFTISEGSRFNLILIITGIVTLIMGILFLIGWRQKKKYRVKNKK
jgi:uncharacterized membrane protein YgdD (TMEM256/DUF423 family)